MGISKGIASFLAIIMRLIYDLVGKSYGLTIIIFTFITKIIMFPISYKQAKAMNDMKKIGPLEQEIREKYKGNKEKTAEELSKMYAEHKINPMASCLPLIVQLFVIIAMFYIVKQPLTYINQMSTNEIKVYMEESMVVGNKTVYKEDYTENQIKDQEIKIAKEKGLIDMNFMGINFGDVPSDALSSKVEESNKPSKIILIIPVLSLLFALVQNKLSQRKMTKEQIEQQKTMNLLLPVLSAYISYKMPVALGIYWLLGSVLQIFSQMIIDKMIEKQCENEGNNKLFGEGDKK